MDLLEINKADLKNTLNAGPFADRFFRSLSCMMSESRDQLLARQLAARSRMQKPTRMATGWI